MSNWKVLSTFTYPHEAHVAQGYLESEGIETLIKDEITTQVHNFYSNAIGGVKLLVHESLFEKGVESLIKGGFISDSSEHIAQEIEIITLTPTTDKEKCPFCNSSNIGKKKEPNILVIILYFLLGAFFPIFKKSYKCFDCEKEWKFKKK
jgi:hypothetical protein